MKKTIGSILLVICMMISIFEINNLPVSAAGKIRLNKTAVTLQGRRKVSAFCEKYAEERESHMD